MNLRGTWYILPTPFTDDGTLDPASLTRLVEASVLWGVDGLTAMGVMGEPGALTAEERARALTAIADAARGRVPLAIGCSAASPGIVRELIEQARGFGAAAAMVAAPQLLRNVDQLPAFYAQAAALGLPLIIQDEPAATGVLVPVSTLLACVEASGARTIKLEDPPTALKISRLLAARQDLAVFGGLGGVAALSELRRGACGTMTGFAYPEILRAVRLATLPASASALNGSSRNSRVFINRAKSNSLSLKGRASAFPVLRSLLLPRRFRAMSIT